MSKDFRIQFDTFPLDEGSWKGIAEKLALSPRQTLMVQLILSDFGNNEIASYLKIGVPTVRSHLKQVYARTNTTDRVSLILKVFKMYHQTIANGEKVEEKATVYTFNRFAS